VNAGAAQYLHVSAASGVFPDNRHFFAEYKDLDRQARPPRMHIHHRSAHEVEVELTAPEDTYIYFAHLVSRHPSSRFSDNYVDIPPGEVRRIYVHDEEHELEPNSLRLGWA
jgi:hypothetical protein